MNEASYNSKIIYRRKIFFNMLAYFFLVCCLIVLSIYFFQNKFLQLILLLLIIVPILLIYKILNFYTFKVRLRINDFTISITILNKQLQTISVQDFDLRDISTYKISFATRRFTEIEFVTRNNISYRFSFLKEVDEDETNADEVINIVHRLMQNYNHTVDLPEEKVLLLPSFYASKSGIITIIVLSLLIFVAIILHIIYSIKSVPITLFLGAILLIQLVIKRQKDVEFFNKMK